MLDVLLCMGPQFGIKTYLLIMCRPTAILISKCQIINCFFFQVRWVVESANARKKRWKYLDHVLPTNQVPFIGDYTRIVCAISNKFFPPLSPGTYLFFCKPFLIAYHFVINISCIWSVLSLILHFFAFIFCTLRK